MPFNQQTLCVKAADHTSWNQYVQATRDAILAAGVGAVIAGVAGMPWCIPFAATILPAVWLISYCEWWLFDRLICLGGDKTIIGMLVSSEPPGNKSFPDSLDTDFSINLLLPPNPPGVDQATAEASVPLGFLMKGQDATNNIGLPCPGETATDPGTGVKSAILHAEFEGNGIADALTGAQVGLALAVASVVACMAIPPPWGVIVAAILALLAVMGTWVYDTAHEGWNELHPIKQCQKVGTWGGDWPPDIDDQIKRWETALNGATAPSTGTEQANPRHGWEVHPDVDGCKPDDSPPPVP